MKSDRVDIMKHVDKINFLYGREEPVVKRQISFEHIFIKKLISNKNVCDADWGERDCIYNYHKFYYFLSGEGKLEIQGDVFVPKPEELYLIPAGVRHTYSHNPNRPIYKCWCHFDLEFQEGQTLVYHKETVVTKLPKEKMVPLFERMNACHTLEEAADSLLEKAALLEIFYHFVMQINYELLVSQENNSFMEAVNQYIRIHLTDSIDLKELAEVVHLHPNYFIRIFRTYYHASPMEYIQMKRLEYAASLMRNHTEWTIEEVAYQSGFHDYRYFGRIFKKRYGITPSSYRGILRKPL